MEGEDASDLLLSSGLPPRMRAGGVLRELDGPILDERGIRELLAPALNESAEAQLRERGSVDLALALPGGPDSLRFRANLFRQQRGLAVALRPIRLRPPSLSELNLPDDLYELVGYPNGLVLVTGPSGSGKSTTLVALTEHLNRRASRHIVTLEDPIEYEYTPQRSLIHQRELGRHVESFSGGLVAALREAPDVILVGEMRDRETIAAALTAADTGHLVLSTLHSANPWMAIDRIVDVFAAEQQREVRTQLAAVLRAVLSQHLLVSTTPPLRVPAYEKLVMTVAAANQIRDDKAHQLQSTIQTGRDDGMVPLEASLAELVRTGRLERGRARGLARDVRMFEELVR
jgi:twitching motility protein PilT